MNPSNNQTTTRRTVVKGAAWATPVIAVALAAPAAAASVIVPPAYDLSVQSLQFNEAANWTPTSGESALYGLGYVTWRVRVCNTGSDAAPAGGLLDIGVGMGPYFDTFSVVSDGGLGLSSMGRSETAAMYGDDSYYRSYWQYRINNAIPAGVCYDVQVKARLRRTPITGYSPVVDASSSTGISKSYNIATLARVTPPTGDDTNAGNNNDAADNLRLVRVHTNSNTTSTAIPGTYTPLPQS